MWSKKKWFWFYGEFRKYNHFWLAVSIRCASAKWMCAMRNLRRSQKDHSAWQVRYLEAVRCFWKGEWLLQATQAPVRKLCGVRAGEWRWRGLQGSLFAAGTIKLLPGRCLKLRFIWFQRVFQDYRLGRSSLASSPACRDRSQHATCQHLHRRRTKKIAFWIFILRYTAVILGSSLLRSCIILPKTFPAETCWHSPANV